MAEETNFMPDLPRGEEIGSGIVDFMATTTPVYTIGTGYSKIGGSGRFALNFSNNEIYFSAGGSVCPSYSLYPRLPVSPFFNISYVKNYTPNNYSGTFIEKSVGYIVGFGYAKGSNNCKAVFLSFSPSIWFSPIGIERSLRVR